MRYIVAKMSNGAIMVLERKSVGEHEVYEPVAEAHTVTQAAGIADALNTKPIPTEAER